MATEVGPAGNASQVFTVPQQNTQRTAEKPETADSNTVEDNIKAEVSETQRVNPESNIGNNVDTTA